MNGAEHRLRIRGRACFETALAFLGGFGSPFGLILGNHDLEGDEFETDAQNLAAWHQARDMARLPYCLCWLVACCLSVAGALRNSPQPRLGASDASAQCFTADT